MLDTFFQTPKYLVEHVNVPIRRGLMDEINWNDRLIAIKGSRGVGKTTFLLQYAKERFGQSRDCLYVNFNNLYFSDNSFLGFVDEFARAGGKTLLLDQTFKYPNWSAGLREQLSLVRIPKGMQGMAIVLVTAGLLSLAFMGFSGVDGGLRVVFGLE